MATFHSWTLYTILVSALTISYKLTNERQIEGQMGAIQILANQIEVASKDNKQRKSLEKFFQQYDISVKIGIFNIHYNRYFDLRIFEIKHFWI